MSQVHGVNRESSGKILVEECGWRRRDRRVAIAFEGVFAVVRLAQVFRLVLMFLVHGDAERSTSFHLPRGVVVIIGQRRRRPRKSPRNLDDIGVAALVVVAVDVDVVVVVPRFMNRRKTAVEKTYEFEV